LQELTEVQEIAEKEKNNFAKAFLVVGFRLHHEFATMVSLI
jgi:hypothetical protein